MRVDTYQEQLRQGRAWGKATRSKKVDLSGPVPPN